MTPSTTPTRSRSVRSLDREREARADRGAGHDADAQRQRVQPVDVAEQRVGDRPGIARIATHASEVPSASLSEQPHPAHEGGHHDHAAADAEQPAETAGGDADEREPPPLLLARAWSTSAIGSWAGVRLDRGRDADRLAGPRAGGRLSRNALNPTSPAVAIMSRWPSPGTTSVSSEPPTAASTPAAATQATMRPRTSPSRR